MDRFIAVVGFAIALALVAAAYHFYSQEVDRLRSDNLLRDAGALILVLFMYLQGTKLVNDIRDKIMKETVCKDLKTSWRDEWVAIQLGIVVMALVFDVVICPTILKGNTGTTMANVVFAGLFLEICVLITLCHVCTLYKEWKKMGIWPYARKAENAD